MITRHNILAYATATDRYVFLYDRADVPELMRTLVRFAEAPDLDLSWREAAIISQHLRSRFGEAARDERGFETGRGCDHQ